MMYNELVESYFFAPNHVGIVDLSQPLSIHYCGGVAGRGDIFDLYLLCDNQGYIIQARFKAYGNPFLIAAAELLCRQLEGSLIHEHPRFNYSWLLQELAIPKTRYSVALQIEDVYREIVMMMQKKLRSVNE
jgi:nitrogen fixation protein NifU and related proteins